MHPHMHLRGKDMTYTAIYPDGRKEDLLRVPKLRLRLADRLLAGAAAAAAEGTKIHVTAHFDNSPANRANPDPKATVRWGDQTWEEMMIFTSSRHRTVEQQGCAYCRVIVAK